MSQNKFGNNGNKTYHSGDSGIGRMICKIVTENLTLLEIENFVIKSEAICFTCKNKLTKNSIQNYDHNGGRMVKGIAKPQWISFECKKCKYCTKIRLIEINIGQKTKVAQFAYCPQCDGKHILWCVSPEFWYCDVKDQFFVLKYPKCNKCNDHFREESLENGYCEICVSEIKEYAFKNTTLINGDYPFN